MDDESYDWLAALMDYYGEEKGKQFAERLGKQELNFRKGNNLLGQLVAAGEIPLMVDGYNHTGYLLKTKQAPIELLFPEPYVTAKTPTGVWIGSHRPTPACGCPVRRLSTIEARPGSDGRSRTL